MPSTMPRTTACQSSIRHQRTDSRPRPTPQPRLRSVASADSRSSAKRLSDSVVTPASAYACSLSAIRSTGPSSDVAVDELQRHRGRRVALALGQVEVLHLAGRVAEAHPGGELVVEVLLPAAHAAEVERGVPADLVGTGRDVVADDHRHGRHHVEAGQGLVRLGPDPAATDAS